MNKYFIYLARLYTYLVVLCLVSSSFNLMFLFLSNGNHQPPPLKSIPSQPSAHVNLSLTNVMYQSIGFGYDSPFFLHIFILFYFLLVSFWENNHFNLTKWRRFRIRWYSHHHNLSFISMDIVNPPPAMLWKEYNDGYDYEWEIKCLINLFG